MVSYAFRTYEWLDLPRARNHPFTHTHFSAITVFPRQNFPLLDFTLNSREFADKNRFPFPEYPVCLKRTFFVRTKQHSHRTEVAGVVRVQRPRSRLLQDMIERRHQGHQRITSRSNILNPSGRHASLPRASFRVQMTLYIQAQTSSHFSF